MHFLLEPSNILKDPFRNEAEILLFCVFDFIQTIALPRFEILHKND